MGSHNLVPAVSPMSASPTFDTEKKPRKLERGEFITPPRPTGRRSNNAALKLVTRTLKPIKNYKKFCLNRNFANKKTSFTVKKVYLAKNKFPCKKKSLENKFRYRKKYSLEEKKTLENKFCVTKNPNIWQNRKTVSKQKITQLKMKYFVL